MGDLNTTTLNETEPIIWMDRVRWDENFEGIAMYRIEPPPILRPTTGENPITASTKLQKGPRGA